MATADESISDLVYIDDNPDDQRLASRTVSRISGNNSIRTITPRETGARDAKGIAEFMQTLRCRLEILDGQMGFTSGPEVAAAMRGHFLSLPGEGEILAGDDLESFQSGKRPLGLFYTGGLATSESRDAAKELLRANVIIGLVQKPSDPTALRPIFSHLIALAKTIGNDFSIFSSSTGVNPFAFNDS